MDIHHLNYFLEVAKYKSFTRAAQALHVTQPTISKMIRNIEEELGVTLFDRSLKHVELTDAGKAILSQAQQIVTSFNNLSSELAEIMNMQKGNIRIGLPPMVGANFFPEILGQFHALYPLINIQLIEYGAKKVEQAIENGSLDIGVVVLPVDERIYASFSFVEEQLSLIVHPAHPLANRKQVGLSELREDNFILFREEFTLHGRIREKCMEAGFQPKIIFESSQWDFISAMVAANLGVALLPPTICKLLDQSRVKVIQVKDPIIPWKLGMIWRKDKYLSFATRQWLAFTRSLLQG